MRSRSGHDLLYALLATLIVAQGTWWVIYQSREGRRYEEAEMRRLSEERAQATLVLATVPELRKDLHRLHESFPGLLIDTGSAEPVVRVDPVVANAIRHEAQRRRKMFLAEGSFFLLLLMAATVVLGFAHRAETRFRRSREILLAGITHEFRTPLASLRLWAETLQRPTLDEAARVRILPKLLEDAGRLEALVGQVLAAGRGGELDPRLFEPLDAGREAKEVLREMEGYLQAHRAEVAADLPEGHEFLGQRLAFAVALRNLVQNAAKYSPSPARIDVRLARDGRWLRLSVHDRGPGIPRADQKRVFESFTRLEDAAREASTSTRGAGLGLFLVKRNAEAMGGRVELASDAGTGSTFTLVLPVRPESS
ncbi:MAG: HAMP domain-containing sensor histidine kinase [bacterium]